MHAWSEEIMEPKWLTFGKRLQAIASNGLYFTQDSFDRERFEEIQSIANEMLALLASVPVKRIQGLISESARGYTTPKIDVRGALIEDDAILLVRERSDGLWTLPGGFADVGLSAARNVEKEFFEEAGLKVSATRLYGVRHKAGSDYSPDVHEFYKMFFLCTRIGRIETRPGIETTDARFFFLEDLPPLSRGRTIQNDIVAAFAFAADPHCPTSFD